MTLAFPACASAEDAGPFSDCDCSYHRTPELVTDQPQGRNTLYSKHVDAA